jgi:hypothetical protein
VAALPHPWTVAQQEVEEVSRLLLDPSVENLERCSALLAAAAGRVAQSPRPEPAVAGDFRTRLDGAKSLLERAAGYHRGWLKILCSLTAGYTSRGEAGPLAAEGHISLHG